MEVELIDANRRNCAAYRPELCESRPSNAYHVLSRKAWYVDVEGATGGADGDAGQDLDGNFCSGFPLPLGGAV